MARQTIPQSGLWSAITNLFNANFTELYTKQASGIYDYQDLATATTPISLTTAGTWYTLTNDGLGPNTNTTYALSSVADVWDSSIDSFDFSGLDLGDSVDIRMSIDVISGTNNQDFDVSLFVNDGGGGQYTLPFISQQSFKTPGTKSLIRFNSIYIGDDNTRNNPARFKIKSSAAGSVIVIGWYCRVIKRIP
ncbi:hypothetical protein OAA60_01145 [Porticoccaceae bacterium]|nr:hypothetical protein [Porticoccaceae bacterium]